MQQERAGWVALVPVLRSRARDGHDADSARQRPGAWFSSEARWR
jgi:hypothetical protein